MHSSLPQFFSTLTVDALAAWAGEAVFQRGHAYHKAGKVRNLALAPDGGLLATVDGTRKYATLLFQEKDGKLASLCTCPYGPRCKHAVAIACAGLALPDGAASIPLADAGDKRLLNLEIAVTPDEAARTGCGFSPQDLEALLNTYSKERLIALVMQAASLAPEVAALCFGKTESQQKDALTLVKEARRAMRNALEEPDWDRHEYIPDYDPVRKKLEILRLAGLPAEVLSGLNCLKTA